MLSDGLTEAMNQEGGAYGTERLFMQLRQAWASGSIRSTCESVYHQVIAFEAKNKDDRTLFTLGRDAL